MSANISLGISLGQVQQQWKDAEVNNPLQGTEELESNLQSTVFELPAPCPGPEILGLYKKR